MTGDWDTVANVAQDRDVEMIAPESNMSARWMQLDMFQKHRDKYNNNVSTRDYRALTPLFGNGARTHKIGKISGVLTKIGKFDIVLMYDASIARLIPIIKLTFVYYEKRERKKQV